MASNVVVLSGGKRQLVKTTPMMPLKEIVKIVCDKQGYSDVDNYGLKQNKTVLDLSLSVRFANLAPGAKLELIRVTTSKAHSEVTIALQMEDGGRIIEKFLSTVTFWEILLHFEDTSQDRSLNLTKRTAAAPQSSKWKKFKSNKLFYQQPVCIVLNKEYGTIPLLKSTSLQSAGITSGNILLRILFRHTELSLDDVLEEINIPIKSSTEMSPVNENNSESAQPTISSESSVQVNPVKTGDSLVPVESKSEIPSPQSQDADEMNIDTKSPDVQDSAVKSSEDQEPITQVEQPSVAYIPFKDPKDLDEEKEKEIKEEMTITKEACESVEGHFDRDVKVFNPPPENAALLTQIPPLPDSFYELTPSELQFLLTTQKSKRETEEGSGFKTRALREREEKARENKYPKTLIRVRFPDNFQIQMTFLSKETVGQLYEFVKGALRTPQRSFCLYTSPLKKPFTDMSISLYHAELTPASVVNFGWTDKLSDSGHFLSDEYLKLRTDIPHDNLTSNIVPEQSSSINDEGAHVTSEPLHRQKAQEQNSHARSSSSNQTSNKLPKWLKLGNKK